MTTASALPTTIMQFVRAIHGDPITVQELGGMSQGRVYRIGTRDGQMVLKYPAHDAEAAFYRTVAAGLAQYGIATPALLAAQQHAGVWWLLLENIPDALPRERWYADRECLAILRRLHNSGDTTPYGCPDGFHPRWTDALTARALSAFPPHQAASLARLLDSVRRAYQHLFAPRCIISGDPNPTNWGLRADRSLVLYDWERVCLGTPPLDLAITIPGLGDTTAFRRVASVYLEDIFVLGASSAYSDASLADEIGIAKLWSVVEFLGDIAAGNVRPGMKSYWLLAQFPDWVRTLVAGKDLADLPG